VRSEDLLGLKAFLQDDPMAQAYIFYGGTRRYKEGNIEVIPVEDALRELTEIIF
jgi:hypothetical protein